MRGLLIKYCRHIIEKTGAVVNELSTFMFKRLKKTIELRIMAVENVR